MKRFISVLVVATSLGSSPLPATDSAPVVAAPAGKLRGAAVGDIHVFKGIPYALPPTGPHALEAPAGGSAMEGHARRDAIRLRRACSPSRSRPASTPGICAPMSEDCLSLNIWAPRRRAQGAGVLLDPRRRALGRHRAAMRCTTAPGSPRAAWWSSPSTIAWACSAFSRIRS